MYQTFGLRISDSNPVEEKLFCFLIALVTYVISINSYTNPPISCNQIRQSEGCRKRLMLHFSCFEINITPFSFFFEEIREIHKISAQIELKIVDVIIFSISGSFKFFYSDFMSSYFFSYSLVKQNLMHIYKGQCFIPK